MLSLRSAVLTLTAAAASSRKAALQYRYEEYYVSARTAATAAFVVLTLLGITVSFTRSISFPLPPSARRVFKKQPKYA